MNKTYKEDSEEAWKADCEEFNMDNKERRRVHELGFEMGKDCAISRINREISDRINSANFLVRWLIRREIKKYKNR